MRRKNAKKVKLKHFSAEGGENLTYEEWPKLTVMRSYFSGNQSPKSWMAPNRPRNVLCSSYRVSLVGNQRVWSSDQFWPPSNTLKVGETEIWHQNPKLENRCLFMKDNSRKSQLSKRCFICSLSYTFSSSKWAPEHRNRFRDDRIPYNQSWSFEVKLNEKRGWAKLKSYSISINFDRR